MRQLAQSTARLTDVNVETVSIYTDDATDQSAHHLDIRSMLLSLILLPEHSAFNTSIVNSKFFDEFKIDLSLNINRFAARESYYLNFAKYFANTLYVR